MRFCDIQNNHNSKLTSADKTRQDFSDITNVETVVSLYIFKKKITANPLHCRKMTVDIGHYFRLHLARGRGGGGGVYCLIRPIRGCAAGQGMGFDLSVLKRVYNFLRVCPALIKLNS